MKDLRRAIVSTIIGSFSLAALLGIAALLAGGEFGEAEGRILLTTVIVGVESVALLCYLALAGHRYAWLGGVGALVSFVPTGVTLLLTWGTEPDFDSGIWQLLWVTVIVAGSIAQAALLIAAGRHRISGGLAGTMLAIAVVAGMAIFPILDESDPGDVYWRLLGVVAILDVLGTVVLLALRAFAHRDDAEGAAGADGAVEERIRRMARERGISRAELLTAGLDLLEQDAAAVRAPAARRAP